MPTSRAWGVALLLSAVMAHPGDDIRQEIAERRSFLNTVQHSSLGHCADALKARGIEARNAARRSDLIQEAREKRGLLGKRTFDSVLAQSHNESGKGYSETTDLSTLFPGNNSCLLTPEVTQGPYYVSGERIRSNVVEDQKGVGLVLDYQIIDVDTCKPVPDVYIEIWQCNSTGVYGGVVAAGNGDPQDQSNIDKTFLRGIQLTNSDGVAHFESLFPGHYRGRTAHIHILVHANATLYQNQTIGSETYASHVGQAFFDQSLISNVESLEPYNSNQQALTTNAEDKYLIEETAIDGVDPLMHYTLLGDSVSDGLFAWLAFGINTSFTKKVDSAAMLYDSGGLKNPNFTFVSSLNPGNGSANGSQTSGGTSSGSTVSTSGARWPAIYTWDLAAMACFIALAVFF